MILSLMVQPGSCQHRCRSSGLWMHSRLGLQEQFHAVLTAFEILSCRLGFDFFEVAGRCVSFLTVMEIDIQYHCSTY